MIEVKVLHWMPGELMDVVKELGSRGYIRGKDFDFAYYQPKYDDTSYQIVYDRHTMFYFHTESLATWFSLTYL